MLPFTMSHPQTPAHGEPESNVSIVTPRAVPRGLILVMLGIAAIGAAEASRPLATEDAAVKVKGECESDSYAGHVTAPGDRGIRARLTQVSCGIGLRTEMALGYSDLRDGGDTKRSLLVAGKTALTDARDDGGGLSLAYGAPAVHEAGAGTHLGDVYATLAGSIPVAARFMLHGNLGWTGSHGNSPNTTRWAAALEYAGGVGLHLGAEAFADDHDHRPWLQIDASQKVGERMSLNASIGRQLQGSGARAVTLGVVFPF